MKRTVSIWPVCGSCCEVATFPWMGGPHRCGDAPPDPLLNVLPVYDPFDEVEDELPEASQYARELIWAVIDTVAGEVGACHEPTVEVTLLSDGGIQISDGGRGIPFTLPHTDTAKTSLAATLEIETHSDGHRWLQRIGLGLPGIVERREPTTNTGTAVRCWATPTFAVATGYGDLAVRLQHLAVLNTGLTITLLDQRPFPQRTRVFSYSNGLTDFVIHVNRTKTPIQRTIIRFAGRIAQLEVDVAAQWNAGYSESISTFANDSHPDYDTALRQGFRDALTTALQGYVDARIPLKSAVPALDTDDICEGLAAVIAVRHDRDLHADEVQSLTNAFCSPRLTRWFSANPVEADIIANKAISAHIARITPRRSACDSAAWA